MVFLEFFLLILNWIELPSNSYCGTVVVTTPQWQTQRHGWARVDSPAEVELETRVVAVRVDVRVPELGLVVVEAVSPSRYR